MLHFLSVLLLFLLFAVVIAIAVGAYLLNKGIRMFRKAADKATGRQTHTEADDGRRGRASGRGGGTTHTATGETIIDTRDRATANRRIFADNEGEYVDFEEEK